MKRLLSNIIITLISIFGLIILFPSSKVLCSTRETISLNGEWGLIFQDNANLPLKNSKWRKTNVPGYLTGYGHKFAWFRKNLVIPLSMQGKKIYLNFSGIKWSSTIFLNGEKAGEYSGAYEPFEVDVTNRCKFGSENEVLVLVGNRFTVLDEETDKILVPTGWHGDINYHGIWGDVTLIAYPKIHVDDIFVIPSTQKMELSIRITIKNLDSSLHQLTISNTAFANDGEEKSFAPANISIDANSTETFEMKNPWQNPILWWPYSPQMYQLKTTLEEKGIAIDEKTIRFGFREFWIEKNQFRFNGKRINLKGAIVYFTDIPDHLKEETARKTFSLLKKANVNFVRLYGQPWPSFWYDIADEMGILIEEESAIQPVASMKIDDERFWENAERHIRGMIKRDRNHPSIIIFTLSNELKSCLMKFPQVTQEELTKKMDYVWKVANKVDPTRPMMHEDGSPLHSKEIENFHYPKEYVYDLNMGGKNYQYPNVAYWFNPNKKDGIHMHPGKPYFIGETLWAVSITPDGDSIFLGDDAYIGFPGSKERAKAIAWEIQLKAYRYTELPAVNPMSILEQSPLRDFVINGEFPINELARTCKKVFEPVAAFITEYGKNFFGGENIEQEITVYNDTLIDSKIRLECNLLSENNRLESNEKEIFIEAGYFKRFKILFRAPEVPEIPEVPGVNDRKEIQLELKLYRGEDLVFSDLKKYSIFPREKLSATKNIKIGLYDKKGGMEKILRASGLKFLLLKDLFEIPEAVDFLIIGPESFEPYPETFAKIIKEKLENFVTQGGRLLILRQNLYPYGLFKISLTDHSPTIAFARAKSHLALNQIFQEDLRFWREDNFISKMDFKKPSDGNMKSLIDSGGVGGLIYSPMVEIIMGKGRAILSQMMLGEKYRQEPIANLILQNIFDYLSSTPTPPKKAGLISQDNFFEQKLRSVGVKYDNISKKLNSEDISKFASLVFYKDSGELLKNEIRIKKYLNEGGNVLICGIKESDWTNIKPFIPQELSLKAAKPLHVVINKTNGKDPLISGISNQDFYWLDDKRNPNFGGPAFLFKDIADSVLVCKNSPDAPVPVVFLTQPGALVKIPYGKGNIIIDQINWEKINPDNQNFEKAKRYITTLLTNLGVDFY